MEKNHKLIHYKRLAVIPARKGSKRIKNKNIRLFENKPILSYSLETAIKSELFDFIHLSTDSRKILDLGCRLGLTKVKLREKLSGDNVPLIDVIREIFLHYKNNNIIYDEIWLIMACSPLLEVKDLIGAKQLFNKNKKITCMPVTKFSSPIERACMLDKNFFIKQKRKKNKNRSQDYLDYFYDTGSFAIFPKFMIESNMNLNIKWLGYEIPKERSVDIDDLSDWKIAEALYRLKNSK